MSLTASPNSEKIYTDNSIKIASAKRDIIAHKQITFFFKSVENSVEFAPFDIIIQISTLNIKTRLSVFMPK